MKKTSSESQPAPSERPDPSLDEIFSAHRDRLLRMIQVRLSPDLRKRVDPEDVLQETYLEAYRQLKNNISKPKGEPIIWLRLILQQKIIAIYRHYCKTQKRDINREHLFHSEEKIQCDSLSLSGFLVGNLTSPSGAAKRQELIEKTRDCLELLDPSEREIISLRNFELLTFAETAQELEMTLSAATSRYLSALRHFKAILKSKNLDQLLEER